MPGNRTAAGSKRLPQTLNAIAQQRVDTTGQADFFRCKILGGRELASYPAISGLTSGGRIFRMKAKRRLTPARIVAL
jgi:hypothetical protein